MAASICGVQTKAYNRVMSGFELLALLLIQHIARSISAPNSALTGYKWAFPPVAPSEEVLVSIQSNFACGLAVTSTGNYLFLIYARQPQPGNVLDPGKDSNGDGLDENFIIWAANFDRPVFLNSELEFERNGNLVLRDSDGTVAWETGTADVGVVNVTLMESGNLVLVTKNGTVVWESFKYPQDTLLPEQPLKVGRRLQDRFSETNMSEGNFYLEVEARGIFLSVEGGQRYAHWCIRDDGSQEIAYVQLGVEALFCYNSTGGVLGEAIIPSNKGAFMPYILRILPSGNLVVLQLDTGNAYSVSENDFQALSSGCGTSPGDCGIGGICTGGQCDCPLPRHRFRDETRPEQGCLLSTPPVCKGSNMTANQMMSFPDLHYQPAIFDADILGGKSGIRFLDVDGCKSLCMSNCTCKGLVFINELCYLLAEIYTLCNKSMGYHSSATFIKLGLSLRLDQHASYRRSQKFPVQVLAAGGAGLVIFSLGLIIWWYRAKRRAAQRWQAEMVSKMKDPAKLFSYKQLHRATHGFSCRAVLGSGGSGTVYKGTLRGDDGKLVVVAIKRGHNVRADKKKMEQFINEVNILSQVNHRNLVKLIGCSIDSKLPLLVYEFVFNGALSEHLQSNKDHLSWKERLRIAAETAEGLAYLHSAASPAIYHRDVKSANILLDETFNAKVADFGISKLVSGDVTHVTTLVQGTLCYLDPEYCQSCRYSDKSDVYSFGVVLLELITGQTAFDCSRPEGSLIAVACPAILANVVESIVDARLVADVEDDKREHLVASLERTSQLAVQCLAAKGEDRPTMKAVAEELRALLTRMTRLLPSSCMQG